LHLISNKEENGETVIRIGYTAEKKRETEPPNFILQDFSIMM